MTSMKYRSSLFAIGCIVLNFSIYTLATSQPDVNEMIALAKKFAYGFLDCSPDRMKEASKELKDSIDKLAKHVDGDQQAELDTVVSMIIDNVENSRFFEAYDSALDCYVIILRCKKNPDVPLQIDIMQIEARRLLLFLEQEVFPAEKYRTSVERISASWQEIGGDIKGRWLSDAMSQTIEALQASLSEENPSLRTFGANVFYSLCNLLLDHWERNHVVQEMKHNSAKLPN